MPAHFHAIVWIDHLQARVFHIGLSGEGRMILHPHLPTRHLHHKANSIGSGHIALDLDFLAEVKNAVSDAGEILIIGPSTAKTELAKFIRDADSKAADRIVAVEAADHPSDSEIIAYARRHFGMSTPRAGLSRGPVAG